MNSPTNQQNSQIPTGAIGVICERPLRIRCLALAVGFLFIWQDVARGLDISGLSYNEKNYVERQGYSAVEFMKQVQDEREYLVRQQKIADILNGNVRIQEATAGQNTLVDDYQRQRISQDLQHSVARAQDAGARAGSGVSGFSYTRYDDNKVIWFKDNLPEKIENEITKDKHDNVTLRNVTNMCYNAQRLLTGYDATVRDPFGNVTLVHWRGAVYTPDSVFYADDETRANKSLTYYEEQIVDPAGGVTTSRIFSDALYQGKDLVSYSELTKDSRSPDAQTKTVRSGIKYDDQRNLTQYDETVSRSFTDSQGDVFERKYQREFRNGVYDKEKNLLAYTEGVYDEYGKTITEFSGTYNQYNELTASTRIQTNQAGNKVTTEFRGQYDEHSRLVSSQETIADSNQSGASLTRKFQAGVNGDYGYNQYGDLTSYSEETTDAYGNVYTRTWYAGTYTAARQLASYKETLTDNQGNYIYKEWKITDGAGGYNRLNQAANYQEITRFGGLVTTRTVTGACYDALNQLACLSEQLTTVGKDSQGNSINYTRQTIQGNARYSSDGQLRQYQEQVVEQAYDPAGKQILKLVTQTDRQDTSLSGFSQTVRTIGEGLDHSVTTIRSDCRYSADRELIGYADKTTDAVSPDAYALVTRNNLRYNGLKQAYSYNETIFNSAYRGDDGKAVADRNVTSIVYNLLGQMISQEENATTLDGSKYDLATKDIIYNGLGQQTAYNQIRTEYGVKAIVTQTSRSGMAYNVNGQLIGYSQDSLLSTDTLNRRTTWSQAAYNSFDQLTSWLDQTETSGFDSLGKVIDFTASTSRLASGYNRKGELVSYSEQTVSSASPDLVSRSDFSRMSYDNYGRVFGFDQLQSQFEQNDLDVLQAVSSINRQRTDYSQDQVIGYRETVTALGSGQGQELNYSVTTERSGMVYDDGQRLIVYHDSVTDSFEPDKTTVIDWHADKFDLNGWLLGFTQTTLETGPDLSLTTTLQRSKMVYNSLYQLIVYQDLSRCDSAQQNVTTTLRKNTVYNRLGQISGFSETTTERSKDRKFYTKSQTERYDITYDKFGQVNIYKQSLSSDSAPDAITLTAWKALGYLRTGQLSAFSQRDQETGAGLPAGRQVLATDSTLTRSDITYDRLGRVNSYGQAIDKQCGDGVSRQAAQVADSIYDSKNRLYGYRETSSDGHNTTVDRRISSRYNSYGFLDQYTAQTTQTNSDGLNAVYQVNWQADDFTYQGLVEAFTQKTSGQAVCGDQTQNKDETLRRYSIDYNKLGLVAYYKEEGESLNAGELSRTWQASGYDLYGRLQSYSEKGVSSSSGPYDLKRQNIKYKVYDNTDCLFAYSESGNAAGNIYQKTWTAGDYDFSGRLLTFQENGFDAGRGVYKIVRAGSSYNGFNEVSDYREQNTNSQGGATDVNRCNIRYDQSGRLSAYQEKRLDPAKTVTDISWSGAQYNDLAQLIKYHSQEDVAGADSTGEIDTTDWQAFADSYDSRGLLKHYQTIASSQDKSSDSLITRTTDWKAASFNRDWQVAGFAQTVRTAGNIVPALPADYDDLAAAQKQAFQDALAGAHIDETVSTKRESIHYDDRGLLQSYQETDTAAGNRQTNIVTWQAGGYDDNGLLEGFTQNTTAKFKAVAADVAAGMLDDSGKLVKSGTTYSQTTRLERSGISYDRQLRAAGYIDRQTRDDFVTTATYSGITYNGLGLQHGYTCGSLAQGYSLGVLGVSTDILTHRLSSSYAAGYLTGWHDRQTSDSDSVTADSRVWGVLYNKEGRQSAYFTDLAKTGTAAGATLDQHSRSLACGLVYNDLGLVTASREITTSLDQKDNVATVDQSNIIYDTKQRRLSYQQATVQQGTTQQASYFFGGQALDGQALSEISGANPGKTLDDLVSSGILERKYSSMSLDSRDVSLRCGITYNDLDQVVSYADSQTKAGLQYKTQSWGLTYDVKGRQIDSNTAVYRKSGAADYQLVSSVQRRGQTYNGLGESAGYQDMVKGLNKAGDDLTDYETVHLGYDTAGRLYSRLTNSYSQGQAVQQTYYYQGQALTPDSLAQIIAANPDKTLAQMVEQALLTLDEQTVSVVTPKVTTLRDSITYNSLGELSGYSEKSTRQGEDGYTLTKLVDAFYSACGEQALSRSQTINVSADGSQNTNDTLSWRRFSADAKLLAGRDLVASTSDDGFGYIAQSLGTSEYGLIIDNQARLTKSSSQGTYVTAGGSRGAASQTSRSFYDNAGFMIHTFSDSTRVDIDLYSNKSQTASQQLYTVFAGSSRLSADLSRTSSQNADTSFSSGNEYTVYTYDHNGRLQDCQGISQADSDDGFGNKTQSSSQMSYQIILDKAKLAKVDTQSSSTNIDGSASEGNSLTEYQYYDTGLLKAASGSSTSNSKDGYGGTSLSQSVQNYNIVNNQALLDVTTNVSDSADVDLTKTHSELTTKYDYVPLNAHGPAIILDTAEAKGFSNSVDSFGGTTDTVITQEYKNIAGQARLLTNTSDSTAGNPDGSSVNSSLTVDYDYYDSGLLKEGAGQGSGYSQSDNGFGDKSFSHLTQDYQRVCGQARLNTSSSDTISVNADNSATYSQSDTAYKYDDKGLVTKGEVSGDSYSYEGDQPQAIDFSGFDTEFSRLADIYGLAQAGKSYESVDSISYSHQSQSLLDFAGKAKTVTSLTAGSAYRADGSSSQTKQTVDYTYNAANGFLETAQGRGISDYDDGYGNKSHSDTVQDYAIYLDQAKQVKESGVSTSRNADGSSSQSSSQTVYHYDQQGHLVTGEDKAADSASTMTSDDGFGNITKTTQEQKYTAIADKAKQHTSLSDSVTTNLDGSTTSAKSGIDYRYDLAGVLIGTAGWGSSSTKDSYGAETSSVSEQTYQIIRSSAKVVTSTSTVKSINANDKAASTVESTTNYHYDEFGRLLDQPGKAADETETASGIDSLGNSFISRAQNQYSQQYGSLRRYYSDTAKTITSGHAGWTKTTQDIWQAGSGRPDAYVFGYDTRGKLIAYRDNTSETGTGTLAGLNTQTTVNWLAGNGVSFAGAYNALGGWLNEYRENSRTVNTVSGKASEISTSTHRYDIAYYGAGDTGPAGRTKSYQETIITSQAPKKKRYHKVDNIAYDTAGMIKTEDYGIKDVAVADAGAETVINQTVGSRKDFVYDASGLATSWADTSISAASPDKQTSSQVRNFYNDLAQVTSSHTDTHDQSKPDDGQSLDHDTQTDQKNFYDVFGQVIRCEQTLSSSDAPDLIVSSTITTTYDDLGRVSSQHDSGKRYSTDGSSLVLQYESDRDDITYNDLGQEISWNETSRDLSSPNKTVSAKVTAEYGDLGRLRKIAKNIIETGPDSSGNYKQETTFDAYNSLGQVVRQTAVFTQGTKVTVTSDLADIRYDSQARQTYTLESVHERDTAAGIDYRYTRERQVDAYNDLGQVARETELTKDGDKTTTKTTLQDIKYDQLGRLFFRKDAVSEQAVDSQNGQVVLDRKSIEETRVDSYDGLGNIKESRTTDYFYKPGLGQYVETSCDKVTNQAFDGNGRLTQYKTEHLALADSNGQRENLGWEVTTNTAFDSGNRVSSQKIAAYAADGTALAEESVQTLKFDSHGRLAQTRDIVQAADQALPAITSSYAYDDYGRLTQETKESLAADVGSKIEIINQAFDSQGQVRQSDTNEYLRQNGSWQFNGVSRRVAAYDQDSNLLSEQISAYSDLERRNLTSFTDNENTFDPANTASRLSGNPSQSVSAIYSDLAKTDCLKTVTTANQLDSRGFITSQQILTQGKNNTNIGFDEKVFTNLNSRGLAAGVAQTTYVFAGFDKIKTAYSQQANSAFDRQGRAVKQETKYFSIADDGSSNLKKTSNTLNWQGRVESAADFLPDGTSLGREVVTNLISGASNKPLLSQIDSFDPSGSLCQRKSVSSSYDPLGNCLRQTTLIDGQIKIERTNNFGAYAAFGWADRAVSNTYTWDGNAYQLINRIVSQSADFDNFGNTRHETITTFLPGDFSAPASRITNDNTYDAKGRLTAQTSTNYAADAQASKQTVLTNGNFDVFGNATSRHSQVSAWINGSWQIQRSSDKSIESNSLGWETYSREIDHDAGSPDLVIAKEFGVDANGNRAPPVYNFQGQLLNYSEKTSQTGPGLAQWSFESFSDIKYNGLNQRTGWLDTQTSAAAGAMVTTDTYSGLTYDGLGRQLAYQCREARRGQVVNAVSETNRSNITYDRFDNISGYNEVSRSNGATTTVNRSAMTYDSFGRLASYRQQEERVAGSIDTITLAVRASTSYDSRGLVTGYSEQSSSSDATGVAIGVNRCAINYDLTGRQTGYTQTETRQGAGLDTRSTSTHNVIAFNSDGLESGYDENQNSSSSSGASTLVSRRGIAYNQNAQTLSYSQTEHTIGSGLDITVVTNRQSTNYDSTTGLVVSYVEDTQNQSAAAGVWTHVSRVNDAYDSRGRVLAYHETQHQTGDGLNVTMDTKRSGIVYGSNGLAIAYNDTQTTHTGTGDMTNSNDCSNIIYDSSGRQFSWRAHETALGLDQTFDRVYTNYNGAGQVTGYREVDPNAKQASVVTVEKGNVSTHKFSYASYTSRIVNLTARFGGQGLIYLSDQAYSTFSQEYAEQWCKDNPDYINRYGAVVFHQYYYDSTNAMWGYVINSQKYCIAIMPSGIENSVLNYLGAGAEPKARFTAEKVMVDVGVDRTVSSMTYNRTGRLSGQAESGRDKDGWHYNFTRSGYVYNNLGQIAKYSETGSNDRYDPRRGNAQRAYSFTKTGFSGGWDYSGDRGIGTEIGMVYNQWGQLTSYLETGSKYFSNVTQDRTYAEIVSGLSYQNGLMITKTTTGGYTGQWAKMTPQTDVGVDYASKPDWLIACAGGDNGVSDGSDALIGKKEAVVYSSDLENNNKWHVGVDSARFTNNWEYSADPVHPGQWQNQGGYQTVWLHKSVTTSADTYDVYLLFRDNLYHGTGGGITNATVEVFRHWASSTTFDYNTNGWLVRSVETGPNDYRNETTYNTNGDAVKSVATGLTDEGKAYRTETNYSYYAPGRLSGTHSVTTQNRLTTTTDTHKRWDGTGYSDSKTDGVTDDGWCIKKTVHKELDALGNATKITGHEETWKEHPDVRHLGQRSFKDLVRRAWHDPARLVNEGLAKLFPESEKYMWQYNPGCALTMFKDHYNNKREKAVHEADITRDDNGQEKINWQAGDNSAGKAMVNTMRVIGTIISCIPAIGWVVGALITMAANALSQYVFFGKVDSRQVVKAGAAYVAAQVVRGALNGIFKGAASNGTNVAAQTAGQAGDAYAAGYAVGSALSSVTGAIINAASFVLAPVMTVVSWVITAVSKAVNVFQQAIQAVAGGSKILAEIIWKGMMAVINKQVVQKNNSTTGLAASMVFSAAAGDGGSCGSKAFVKETDTGFVAEIKFDPETFKQNLVAYMAKELIDVKVGEAISRNAGPATAALVQASAVPRSIDASTTFGKIAQTLTQPEFIGLAFESAGANEEWVAFGEGAASARASLAAKDRMTKQAIAEYISDKAWDSGLKQAYRQEMKASGQGGFTSWRERVPEEFTSSDEAISQPGGYKSEVFAEQSNQRLDQKDNTAFQEEQKIKVIEADKTTAIKEFGNLLIDKNAIIEAAYKLDENGLRLEARVLVGGLNKDIQQACKEAGLGINDQVTLVKDFLSGRTYVKFEFDASKLESFVGDVSSMVDTKKISGKLEGRIYTNADGTILDQSVVMTVNTSALTETRAKNITQVLAAKTATLELSQKGKITNSLKFASSLNAADSIAALKNIGEADMAADLEKSLGSQVQNLSKVKDLQFDLKIEKTGQGYKTGALRTVTYRTDSGNLKDADAKSLLDKLGTKEVGLTTNFTETGDAKTYVSDISFDASKLTPEVLTMLEKDQDFSAVFAAIKTQVFNQLKPNAKVKCELRTVLSDDGKPVTLAMVTLDVADIEPGKLYDKVKASGLTGKVNLAVTSRDANEVIITKAESKGQTNDQKTRVQTISNVNDPSRDALKALPASFGESANLQSTYDRLLNFSAYLQAEYPGLADSVSVKVVRAAVSNLKKMYDHYQKVLAEKGWGAQARSAMQAYQQFAKEFIVLAEKAKAVMFDVYAHPESAWDIVYAGAEELGERLSVLAGQKDNDPDITSGEIRYDAVISDAVDVHRIINDKRIPLDLKLPLIGLTLALPFGTDKLFNKAARRVLIRQMYRENIENGSKLTFKTYKVKYNSARNAADIHTLKHGGKIIDDTTRLVQKTASPIIDRIKAAKDNAFNGLFAWTSGKNAAKGSFWKAYQRYAGNVYGSFKEAWESMFRGAKVSPRGAGISNPKDSGVYKGFGRAIEQRTGDVIQRTGVATNFKFGLSKVAETVGEIPKAAFIDDPISTGLEDGFIRARKVSLAQGTGNVDSAWRGAWDQTGLRFGGLVDGVSAVLNNSALAENRMLVGSSLMVVALGQAFSDQPATPSRGVPLWRDGNRDNRVSTVKPVGAAAPIQTGLKACGDFIGAAGALFIPDALAAGYYAPKAKSWLSDMWAGVKGMAVGAKSGLKDGAVAVLGLYVCSDEELGRQKAYNFADGRIVAEGAYANESGSSWAGSFNIRNSYAVKPYEQNSPYLANIYLPRGEKSYDFKLSTAMPVSELKNATHVNLFVHGYNCTDVEAKDFYRKMSRYLFKAGYDDHNTLVSWSGDVGGNPITKSVLFNRDTQSARISAPALVNAVDYIHSINPDAKINTVTHSLGARLLLEAAAMGAHFGTVIMLVPAIDDGEICVGGKYAAAIKNIDRLVIVSSKNQALVFGPYALARLSMAAGDIGVAGRVDHSDFTYIEATKAKNNPYGIEVNKHGDIYEPETIRMIKDYLSENN